MEQPSAGPPHPSGPPEPLDAERVLKALWQMPPGQVVEPGVTAADAREVMTVPPAPEGCVHVPDQVYGTAGHGGRALTMHLYAAEDPSERRPGVMFVHGGGFLEGFPEMLIRYAGHLAASGYVTACIRYRLATEAPWPACLEDAKCAVRWMRAHHGSIGLDPGRLAVAGNSAGGNLAAMVASTPGAFEGSGGHEDVPSAVRAAVLWYPGLDLRPSSASPVVRELAPKLFWTEDVTEELAAAASPVTYAERMVPVLTFVGDSDPIVPLRTVRAYHDALAVPNRLVVVEGAGHSFDYSLQRWRECFEELAAFLGAELDAPTARGGSR